VKPSSATSQQSPEIAAGFLPNLRTETVFKLSAVEERVRVWACLRSVVPRLAGRSPLVDTWSLRPSAPPQYSLAGLTVHTAAQCTSGSPKTHGSASPSVSNVKARASGKSRNAYRSPFPARYSSQSCSTIFMWSSISTSTRAIARLSLSEASWFRAFWLCLPF